jgi:polyisoprenoid-binding protein YceI
MPLLKKLVIVVAAAAVLVVGGAVVYVQFIRDDAPPELDFLPTGPTTPGATAAAGGTGGGADGVWTVADGTEVGYRVKEDFIGGLQNAEGVGRTADVTGSLTVRGTTAVTAQFTADLTTLRSDDRRRDGQVQGRILQTAQFPTATFRLAEPIAFGRIPTGAAEVVTAEAVGDLTLRGVTKRVTFGVEAILDNGVLQVKGALPVVFADYGIPNPSNAIVSVRDEGVMEFRLVLRR